MPGPLHVIFRLLMIFIGILAAAFAAGVTLMLVETSGLMRPADITEGQARDAIFAHVVVISGYALLLGFLPAFVSGLLAEIFRWRTILYFGIVGGLIGVYLLFEPIPSWINITREGPSLIANAAKAYPAAGIVAGAMYWLVAGCKAGFFRETAQSASTPRREE